MTGAEKVLKEDPYYDKNGIEIKEFAILKIYHFYGRTLRNGNGHNYMYKWIRLKNSNGKLCWAGYHLTNNKDQSFWLRAVASPKKVITNAEIVQQIY